MNDLVRAVPQRADLEAMTLEDRVALEDAFGEAHDLIRSLNDAEIWRLREAGASQRAIAQAAGRSQHWVRHRLGLRSPSDDSPNRVVLQNGDGSYDDAEVVDAVIVPEPRTDDRPSHYLPDVVDPDADQNLRTQALHWFEQGRVVEELLNEDATVDPRDRADRTAIKREAGEMARIARRLKGAF